MPHICYIQVNVLISIFQFLGNTGKLKQAFACNVYLGDATFLASTNWLPWIGGVFIQFTLYRTKPETMTLDFQKPGISQ